MEYGRNRALFLHTDRRNHLTANTRTRKFALYKQPAPIHQWSYNRFCCKETRALAELTIQVFSYTAVNVFGNTIKCPAFEIYLVAFIFAFIIEYTRR